MGNLEKTKGNKRTKQAIPLPAVLELLGHARHVCTNETLPDNKDWLRLHNEGVTGWNHALEYIANELKQLYPVTDLASNNPEASAELSNPHKESL